MPTMVLLAGAFEVEITKGAQRTCTQLSGRIWKMWKLK